MLFVTLAQARQHLRIDAVDASADADLQIKIAAAERWAAEYLQRNVYADQAALDAAIALVPDDMAAAKAALIAAGEAAALIEDVDLRDLETAHAKNVYMSAVYESVRTRNGIVINDLILAAMLLILGWLHEVREDVAELPAAARYLLDPFRSWA